MHQKGISVVIPNYNGSALFPQSLPAVFEALQQAGLPYEVIISDDCSTDNSIGYIRENFPAVILLEATTNSGFAPTINKGIFAAQYDLVLLLNSDVKLSANYFEKQLPYFEAEDTFGIMGRIIGWDDDTIQDGGKYPGFHGVKIKTSGNYIPVDPENKALLPSMYLSGANALVSREKIICLGGFNEIFAPFYVEDVELSLRAWRMGWKCYYEHNSICRHRTSSSIKAKSKKIFIKKIYYRNKMFLHAIHLKPGQRFLWHFQLGIEVLVQVIIGKFWYLSSLKMYLGAHKKIKASREDLKKAAGKNTLLSTDTVMKKILHSLGFIPIKRF